MTVFVKGNSQDFTLPTWVIDSMIYEVKKGRTCDSLQNIQQIEIIKLNNYVINLEAGIEALELENKINKDLLETSDLIIEENKEKYKKTTKKLKFIVGIELIIIILILI